ncbi:MAG: hypothetical protein CMF43_01950 [Legionellales bacterium]|nr:hypothetical protein [Legionellales bacterium]
MPNPTETGSNEDNIFTGAQGQSDQTPADSSNSTADDTQNTSAASSSEREADVVHQITTSQSLADNNNDAKTGVDAAVVPATKKNAIVAAITKLPVTAHSAVATRLSSVITFVKNIVSAVYKFVGAQLGKLAGGVSTMYGKATTGLSSLHTSYTKPAIDKVGKFYSGYNQYESKYAQYSAYAVVGALAVAAGYMALELNFPVAQVAAGVAIAVVASLTLASTMPKYFGGFGYAMSNAILTPLVFAANKISAGYSAVAAAASRVSNFAHAQYEKLSNAVVNNDSMTVESGTGGAKEVGSSIFLAPVSYLSGFFNELSKFVSGNKKGVEGATPTTPNADESNNDAATLTAGGGV